MHSREIVIRRLLLSALSSLRAYGRFRWKTDLVPDLITHGVAMCVIVVALHAGFVWIGAADAWARAFTALIGSLFVMPLVLERRGIRAFRKWRAACAEGGYITQETFRKRLGVSKATFASYQDCFEQTISPEMAEPVFRDVTWEDLAKDPRITRIILRDPDREFLVKCCLSDDVRSQILLQMIAR